MSSQDGQVNRGLLTVLGVVVGLALAALAWVTLVQPLMGSDELVQSDGLSDPTPTLTAAPLPDGDVAAPLPDPLTPADGVADIDTLMELGEVSEEVFQIAGARDPFRQVVVEAQVGEPTTATGVGTATSGGTTTTTDDGTTGGSADGSTSGGSSSDGTADEPAVGTGPDGISELAATGLTVGQMGPAPLSLLALALMLLGLALVRGPHRQG